VDGGGDQTQGRTADRYGLATFLFYLILSAIFFGRDLVGHLSDRYVGKGCDPGHFIFFLAWWAHAITHHLNPFLTKVVWAPSGFNLAWTTFVPLAGVLATPFTTHFGPVATYNVAMLLCPALAAWSAFLLCRYISSALWPSLIGGYIFGFSPYMLGHLVGLLHALLVFTIPLIVYVILARLDGRLSIRQVVPLLSALIVVEFLCATELVATSVLFGVIASLIAWFTGNKDFRQKLRALELPILGAFAISAVVLSPYLYYFFMPGRPHYPAGFERTYVDPFTLLIPSPLNVLGSLRIAERWCKGPGISEVGSYIGLPGLIILLGFGITSWKEQRGKLLVILFATTTILSFGRTLIIFGHPLYPMPWRLIGYIPLIGMALPSRLSVYPSLILALVFTLWLSRASISIVIRSIAGASALFLLLPNLAASYWVTSVDSPEFFATELYKQYISPGDNVLIIPYGSSADSDVWLANTGMYFRMPEGWIGPLAFAPAEFEHFPLVYALYNLANVPEAADELKVFLAQKDVHEIIIADEGKQLWGGDNDHGPPTALRVALDSQQKEALGLLISTLGVRPTRIGGVAIYKVPLDEIRPYRRVDARQIEEKILSERINLLIVAAQKLLTLGLRPDDLNLFQAVWHGLLPSSWVPGADANGSPTAVRSLQGSPSLFVNGMLLTTGKTGIVAGVTGSRDVLERMASDYSSDASDWMVAPPQPYSNIFAENTQYVLELEYDRQRLDRAAESARLLLRQTRKSSGLDELPLAGR
jgi:hypothetical protein